MKNDRNAIYDNYNNIVDALKEYGMWDELNSSEKTRKSYKNVPYLLESNDVVGKKLVTFMDTMLEEIEKKQFEIIYHRTIDDMSALHSEYDEAVAEGVKFNWESNLVEILDYNGTLSGVVIEHGGERRTEKADKVLMAIGSVPASRIVSTTKGIETDESGYVLTREKPCGMTSRKGVFAGGDVVNRPSTVVLAMRDAKKVAEGIAQYVDAIKLLEAINMNEHIKK